MSMYLKTKEGELYAGFSQQEIEFYSQDKSYLKCANTIQHLCDIFILKFSDEDKFYPLSDMYEAENFMKGKARAEFVIYGCVIGNADELPKVNVVAQIKSTTKKWELLPRKENK